MCVHNSQETGDVGEWITTKVKINCSLTQVSKRDRSIYMFFFSTFAEKYLESLTPAQLAEYDILINKPSNDWQIYYWVTGKEEIPADYCTSVMRLLQQHTSNEQKETRIRQPDLYNK